MRDYERRGLLVPGTRKHTHRGAAMEGAELRRPGHAKTMRDYERRIRQTKDNMVHGREIRGPFLSPDEYASGYAYDHAWAELEDRKIQARRALWCGVSVARAALEHLKAQGAITFEDAEAIGEVLNLCALYTAAGAEVERDQRTRMLRLANNVQGKHANAVHDLAWTVMQLATYCNDEWKPAQQRDSVRHNTQALPRVLSVGRSLKEGQSDAIRVLRAAASGDLPEPPPARQRSKASLRTKANDVRAPRVEVELAQTRSLARTGPERVLDEARRKNASPFRVTWALLCAVVAGREVFLRRASSSTRSGPVRASDRVCASSTSTLGARTSLAFVRSDALLRWRAGGGSGRSPLAAARRTRIASDCPSLSERPTDSTLGSAWVL
jgi:hypothetical protein